MLSIQCPKCYTLFSWGILIEHQWDFCPYCSFGLWAYYKQAFDEKDVLLFPDSFR